MKAVFSLLLILLMLSFAHDGFAQESDAGKKSKSGKTLISVPVAVSDRLGRYITGLHKSDFTIFQDGAKQEIVSFAAENEPINVALLIDTSQSTKKVIGKIKDAAKDFIGLLGPQDKCLIATFDSGVHILASLNSDHQLLEDALKTARISNTSGTVMRKAVNQIADGYFSNIEGRKAMIILTDGKDFGSFQSKEELLDKLQESDIMIYTIFYKTGLKTAKITTVSDEKKDSKVEKQPKMKKGKFGITLSTPEADFPSQAEIDDREKKSDAEAIDTLKGMSEATAGRFYFKDVTNIGKTFDQIADELRQQYRISFYQFGTENSGEVHQIKVKVSDPELVVRARGTFRAKQLKRTDN